MLVTNAIKKLSKAGTVRHDNQKYWATIGEYEVSFLVNGCDGPDACITCERARRITDHDDSQSDYTAGSFFDSLTQAIRYAQERTAQNGS